MRWYLTDTGKPPQLGAAAHVTALDPSRIILIAEAAPAPDDPAAAPANPTLPATQATSTDFQATTAKEEADY